MARKPLPMLAERREDYSICGPCGGKCCKSLPGIAVPEDFGAPDRAVMRERLLAAFRTGRWAIDWWEGDPRSPEDRDGENDWMSEAEFVRPAESGYEGQLHHGSWGGECTFLGANGCELQYEQRPRNCRALVPVVQVKGASCAEKFEDGSYIEKRDYVMAWLPYEDLLVEVADEVRHAA